jgi:putative glutathione S-transferase
MVLKLTCMVDEKNCRTLFEGMDRVEGILTKSLFLVGDYFTEADVRLFTTILRYISWMISIIIYKFHPFHFIITHRFDPVYHGHFKVELKKLCYHHESLCVSCSFRIARTTFSAT